MSARDDDDVIPQDEIEEAEGASLQDRPAELAVSLQDLDRAPVNLPVSSAPVSQADYDDLRAKFTQVSNEKLAFSLRLMSSISVLGRLKY